MPFLRAHEERSLRDTGLTLELAAVSDIGTVRTENQDGWRITALKAGSTDNVTVVVCQINSMPREKS